MALLISAAQRRFLVVASSFFFVFSVFFCVSRLVGTSFEPLEVEPIVMPKIEINMADNQMSYGQFHRPGYDSITHTSALPEKYIPTKENERRLIVIGDIHGMLKPLEQLLKKTSFDPAKDHVISVGDMINKGPNSAEVVQRLMDLNATAVRGNHEDRVLVAWNGLNEQIGVEAYLDSEHETLRRGKDKDLETARQLSESQIEWLKSLPVLLTIEPLAVYIVHAGLVPGIPIDSQDPWAMMNMRTLRFPRAEFRAKEEAKKQKKIAEQRKKEQDRMQKFEQKGSGKKKREEGGFAKPAPLEIDSDSSSDGLIDSGARATPSSAEPIAELMSLPDHDVWVPVDNRDGQPWSNIWNYLQGNIDASLRRTIIYGHDAKLGYQENTYSYGIDSGCVKGHALTALIISASDKGSFNSTTMQVICKDPNSKSWW